MTSEGQNRAKEAVSRIDAKGTTDLASGLLQGADILFRRPSSSSESQTTQDSPAKIASVLLFTDGLANIGITSGPAIVAELERICSVHNYGLLPFTVHTFGYGPEHNAFLLDYVAKAGRGTYYFIQRSSDIGEMMVDCLAGLLSTFALDVRLEIRGSSGVRLQRPLTKFPIEESSTPNSYTIRLGELQSEERRDVLLEVEIPQFSSSSSSSPSPSRMPLFSLTLDYFDVATNQRQQRHQDVVVDLNESQNRFVSFQVNRYTTILALEQALALADQRQIKEARKCIQRAIESIQASEAAEESAELIKNLEQVWSTLKSEQEYQTFGSKLLLQTQSAHTQQRSTTSEENLYTTTLRRTMKSLFQDSSAKPHKQR